MRRPGSHGRIRPSGLSRPAVWLLVIALGAFGIAATTGSGWLLVLIAGLVGVVLVACVSPAIAVAGIRVRACGPRDAEVGRPCEVTLELSGRPTVCTVEISGNGPKTERRADVPASGSLPFVPTRRGLLSELGVRLTSSAPLGLVRWRRTATIALDRTTVVAPEPSFGEPLPPGSADDWAGEGPDVKGHALVRGVREYVPGDPPKLIHWPATAHARSLMVREVEDPGRPTTVVLVDLNQGDVSEREAAASASFGVVIQGLEAGMTVVLATRESDGPRLVAVTTRTEAGRRIGLAVPGSLPAVSSGATTVGGAPR